MNSGIVSIRMPTSLVIELKELAKKDHFMDLSDEIRFILKQKMTEKKDPFTQQIQKLKDELKSEIAKKSEQDKAIFVDELRKLLDEIRKE